MDTQSITPTLQAILGKFRNAVDEAAGEAKTEMWKELKKAKETGKVAEQLKAKSHGEVVAEKSVVVGNNADNEFFIQLQGSGMTYMGIPRKQAATESEVGVLRDWLAKLIDSEIARERERIAVMLEKDGHRWAACEVRQGQ